MVIVFSSLRMRLFKGLRDWQGHAREFAQIMKKCFNFYISRQYTVTKSNILCLRHWWQDGENSTTVMLGGIDEIIPDRNYVNARLHAKIGVQE